MAEVLIAEVIAEYKTGRGSSHTTFGWNLDRPALVGVVTATIEYSA